MSQTLSPKILVLGANGQLGRAMVELLGTKNCIAASRSDADLANPQQCVAYVERVKPSVIINAAAYTYVDQAEQELPAAHQINAGTPKALAQWCREENVPFVHFSTDYVFSGWGDRPWQETDPVSPVNTYGQTKLAGEEAITAVGGRYLIFRTSWVYDAIGKNFLTTMIRLGQEREVLRVVSDQHGAPTYAPALARGAWTALERALEMPKFPSGIYHLCNLGETTWFHFAQAIFREARENGLKLRVEQIEGIPSSEYVAPARRPQNSRLNTDKVHETFGVALPIWEESLKACLQVLIARPREKKVVHEN